MSCSTAPVVLPGVTLLEIAGLQRVLIENHCGIITYDCADIRIRTEYGYICVIGNNLNLANISRERLVITGEIEGLRLHREETE